MTRRKSEYPTNSFARLIATISVLACGHATIPVLADQHTDAECREGGEFIRDAARSRDAGMAREVFMNQLINDLMAIYSFAPEPRWFARDESDEQMLIEHAERVFDRLADPLQHEGEFLKAYQSQRNAVWRTEWRK